MYEQSSGWKAYYCEPDPKKRRKMLDELFETEPDDGANMYRLRLWEARYLDPKHPGAEVDRFLFQFVNMIQLYRTARLYRKSAIRQITRAFQEMLFSEAAACGAAGEGALYWELRNAAARYLKTCEASGYNRAVFGMVPSSDFGRRNRVCQEIWEMTRGLAARTGMEQEMQLWNRAVLDAYSQFDYSAQGRLAAYESGKKK